MSDRFILWVNPDQEVEKDTVTRDIDKEDLFKFMVAFGCTPLYAEGEATASNVIIWVHFLPAEVEKFENMYYSNKDPVLPVSRLSYANDLWRNMMASAKSKRRYLDKLAQKNGQ